jgi:hypothetical protein
MQASASISSRLDISLRRRKRRSEACRRICAVEISMRLHQVCAAHHQALVAPGRGCRCNGVADEHDGRSRDNSGRSQRRPARRFEAQQDRHPIGRSAATARRPQRGAVLGCNRPSRSPCTSMMFLQLNGGVSLSLTPRLGTFTGAPTCSLDAARRHDMPFWPCVVRGR